AASESRQAAVSGSLHQLSTIAVTFGLMLRLRSSPELDDESDGDRAHDGEHGAERDHHALLREGRVVDVGDARMIDDADALLAQDVLELGDFELLLQRDVGGLVHGAVADEPAE